MITVHTEHIGSLLRPAELLKARVELDRRSLTPREFQAIEDAAVEHVLSLQHQAGCEVVTDGEYRRVSFQSVLVEGTEGLGEWDLETFLWGDWYGDGLEPWHRPRPESLGVAGKLVRKRHRAVEEFQYVRDRTDRIVKVTLPSPSLLANFWSAERSKPVYPTLETFLDDVALLVKSEVSELARLGCEYVQLDAPHYPLLLDEKTRSFYQRQ
ncbi:MAG: methionine synthase, partial [Planctomycetota bacterium]